MKRKPPQRMPGQGRGRRGIGGSLLGVEEAAEYLGLTPNTVRSRAARRLLPFKKWGGRVVFVRNQLDSFTESLPGCSVEEALINVEARQDGWSHARPKRGAFECLE